MIKNKFKNQNQSNQSNQSDLSDQNKDKNLMIKNKFKNQNQSNQSNQSDQSDQNKDKNLMIKNILDKKIKDQIINQLINLDQINQDNYHQSIINLLLDDDLDLINILFDYQILNHQDYQFDDDKYQLSIDIYQIIKFLIDDLIYQSIN